MRPISYEFTIPTPEQYKEFKADILLISEKVKCGVVPKFDDEKQTAFFDCDSVIYIHFLTNT